MLKTTSQKRFNEWAALTQLLQEAFRYMEGRIDPPSSLETMGIEEPNKKVPSASHFLSALMSAITAPNRSVAT